MLPTNWWSSCCLHDRAVLQLQWTLLAKLNKQNMQALSVSAQAPYIQTFDTHHRISAAYWTIYTVKQLQGNQNIRVHNSIGKRLPVHAPRKPLITAVNQLSVVHGMHIIMNAWQHLTFVTHGSQTMKTSSVALYTGQLPQLTAADAAASARCILS